MLTSCQEHDHDSGTTHGDLLCQTDSHGEHHIWRLNQQKSIATAHIVVNDRTVRDFAQTAKIIMECLHAYGIHSATIQPEAVPPVAASHVERASTDSKTTTIREGQVNLSACQVLCCCSVCSEMKCCR